MTERFADKVAIVTGAGQGIGRGIAAGLAEAGAHVALAARTRPDLEEVAQEIRELGRNALVVPTDVMDPDALETLVQATVRELTAPARSRQEAGLQHSSSGADGDSGIVQCQPGLVVDEAAGEIKNRSGVVITMAFGLAEGAPVGLIQPFHGKTDGADVGGRSSRTGTGCQAHPAHRQRVGHGRGLQIHIEAAVKVGRWHAVDQPPACSIGLKKCRGRPHG